MDPLMNTHLNWDTEPCVALGEHLASQRHAYPECPTYSRNEDDTVTLVLPRADVQTLLHVLYKYVTPAMGIDQLLHDEIADQLAGQ